MPLNPQGFAKISDLEDQEYSYVVRAKGHKELMGTFNPARNSLITVNLKQ